MCKRLSIALVLLSLAVATASVGVHGAEKKAKGGKGSLGIIVEPTPQGLVAREIPADSPAAKAGLKAGDVIQKIDKTAVSGYEQLVQELGKHSAGEKIQVQVRRDGKEQELNVTLGEQPGRPETVQGVVVIGRGSAYLGVESVSVTPEVKKELSLKADKGVAVLEVSPESPAMKAGLRRGDVILKAGGKEVSDPRELRDAVSKAGAGKELKLQVQRGEETKDVTATLKEQTGGLNMTFPFRPPIGVGRDVTSLPKALQTINDLEKKVQDLEKRVRQLEQKSGKPAE